MPLVETWLSSVIRLNEAISQQENILIKLFELEWYDYEKYFFFLKQSVSQTINRYMLSYIHTVRTMYLSHIQ